MTLIEILLYFSGGAFGMWWFGVIILPISYGLPRSLYLIGKKTLEARAVLPYLGTFALWSVIFITIAFLMAAFFPGAVHYLYSSHGFYYGQWSGVIGSLSYAFTRTGRENLNDDFWTAMAKYRRADSLDDVQHDITEFSQRDLDRPWSSAELAQLSQRDLTKLAFRRALKNAAFFVPQAVVIGLIAGVLGLTGKIIAWLAIIVLAGLALEPLAGFATSVVVLVGIVAGKHPTGHSDVSWRVLQLLLALVNVALDAGLAMWIYTRMNA